MKKFAVIGDPIKHSLSPLLHNWIFNQLEIDAHYSKIRVPQNELRSSIEKVRNGKLAGINITIPHKTKIMEYIDVVNPRAKLIGAINFIMPASGKVIGNNTDWYGFTLALKRNEIDVNKREVILIGAGGVSKGIIFALKQQGVTRVHLFNRTFKKISELYDEFIHPHKITDLENVIHSDSIIINCTSVGMNAADSPIASHLLSKDQTIIDTIYNPVKTKLLVDAEGVGARTMIGLDMFIYQALASQDLWFGEDISNRVNFDDLKRYIESNLC